MNTSTKPAKVYLNCAETAKLVRKALKVFPGVKFSVRSSTYSGGASIRVRWTDGPSLDEVEAITRQFEGATFDGMQDLKEYVTREMEINGEIVQVHHGADFIFTERRYTVAAYAPVAQEVAEQWGFDEAFEVGESEYGGAYLTVNPFHPRCRLYLSDAVYREIRKRPIQETPNTHGG